MATRRAKSTVSGECERCRRHYFEVRQSGGLQKYCPDCRLIVRREKSREYARRSREKSKALRAANIEAFAGRYGYDLSATIKRIDRLMSPIGFVYEWLG